MYIILFFIYYIILKFIHNIILKLLLTNCENSQLFCLRIRKINELKLYYYIIKQGICQKIKFISIK